MNTRFEVYKLKYNHMTNRIDYWWHADCDSLEQALQCKIDIISNKGKAIIMKREYQGLNFSQIARMYFNRFPK